MAAEGGDNGLTRSELVTTLIGFLVASYHTTKVAMTNTVLALLSHDGERARLMAQPDLARNAWEESLRYDSPVHFIHRYASETLTVGGRDIARASGCCWDCMRRAGTRPASRRPTVTRSTGPTTAIWPSRAAAISAWARSCPDWKAMCCCARSSSAFPACA